MKMKKIYLKPKTIVERLSTENEILSGSVYSVNGYYSESPQLAKPKVSGRVAWHEEMKSYPSCLWDD